MPLNRTPADQATLDRRIDLYLRRGWAPVPWAHHPPHIKEAIREARMVPKMKSCFENSQRIILKTRRPFTYAEGWVATAHTPFPIQHGWLIDDSTGERVDLTLKVQDVKPLVSWTVARDELVLILAGRGFYGPLKEPQFLINQTNAWNALSPNLPTHIQIEFDSKSARVTST